MRRQAEALLRAMGMFRIRGGEAAAPQPVPAAEPGPEPIAAASPARREAPEAAVTTAADARDEWQEF
jgi:hypothetical protein